MDSLKFPLFLAFSLLISPLFAQEEIDSQLSKGELYRLQVPAEGVYEIDYDYLEQTLDISPASINTRELRLLTKGGGTIPRANSAERIEDLIELQFISRGLEDGSFDRGDKIVFYSEGPEDISVSSEKNTFQVDVNPFDFHNYIFLQLGVPAQKSNIPEQSRPNSVDQNFKDVLLYQHHEKELINIQDHVILTHGTGKEWYGESFSLNHSQNLLSNFEGLDNIEEDRPLTLSFSFAGRTRSGANLEVLLNEEKSTYIIQSVRLDNSESTVARVASGDISISTSAVEKLEMNFRPFNSSDEGWLDYLTLNYYKNNLSGELGKRFTLPDASSSSFSLDLSGLSSSAKVINISKTGNYYALPSETIENGGTRFFDQGVQHPSYYVAIQAEGQHPSPEFDTRIDNQNIRTIEPPQCLVVYHRNFKDAVDRWVQHRTQHSGITVEAVEVEKIYNEFGGGKQDPGAIRDFVRHLHEKDKGLEYLLLFGAGSFDYRHIVKSYANTNFVPVYETDQSLNPITGYPTDDFYGLIAPNQGADLVGALRINIGRLPARNQEEAHTLVDKIIRYETDPNHRGDWQNRQVFLGDDGDSNIHVRDADNIAEKVRENPDFNIEKIYFDAFPRVSQAGGARFPKASEKLDEAIFKGTLIVNYLGHGGPYGWAHERVLTNEQILSWTNTDQLPLFVTATCTFGVYDHPGLNSSGEILVTKDDGGAIALFTTCRPVYASSNRRLAMATFQRMFNRDSVRHQYWPIGRILREAKNANRSDTTTNNARKFILLGDPTLRLNIPRHNIVTTSFNSQNAQLNTDSVRPLEKVEVEGYIANVEGMPLDDFHGEISITLFDKERERETLGQSGDSKVRKFKSQENVLWKGKVRVKSGQFAFEFVLPKSIDPEWGKGKLSYFAIDHSDIERDAKGAFENFYIGGSPKDSTLNTTPPIVDLYLENERFENGQKVGPNPLMYVKLEDELGISLSENNLGRQIVAILDDNTSNPIVLNSFFEPSLEDYRKGEIFYPLKNLAPGQHTLKVRAWNLAGQMGTSEIDFVVVENETREIFELEAYPNPFRESVCIEIQTKLPRGKYNGTIEIYSSAGQLIDELPVDFILQGSHSPCLEWQPGNLQSAYASSGLFFARLKVENNTDGDIIYSPAIKLVRQE